MAQTEQIKFSVNQWSHLYSLTQAIQYQADNSGRSLLIEGQLPTTQLPADSIRLRFIHSTETPSYGQTENGQLQLGLMRLENKQLTGEIHVADDVFNELKKNLIEYADIEGIHIIFNLQLTNEPQVQQWQIIQLDYAMKGDR